MADSVTLPLVVRAVVGGAGFALIGIAYRLGKPRGVAPPAIASLMGLAGTVFFAFDVRREMLEQMPLALWLVAIVAGVGQYLIVKAMRVALRHGPLSPCWCATMLGFVPVTLYTWAVWDETPSAVQLLGVGVGIVCVAVGSLQQSGDAHMAPTKRSVRGLLVYLLILLVVFALNSVPYTVVKDLERRAWTAEQSCLETFGGLYFTLIYLVLGLTCALDMLVSHHSRSPLAPAAAFGSIAAAGSVCGMTAMAACAVMPAAVTFTVISIASLLVAAVVSVLAFREKATIAWWAMMALGVLSVVLLNCRSGG